MRCVATLIAAPGHALAPALVTKVTALLPEPHEPVWLDPAVAADIPFAAAEAFDPAEGPASIAWYLRSLEDGLRPVLAGEPVDLVLQEDGPFRRKRLLVADMDSTMIGQECIDELADALGLKAEVAAITERAMRGDIAFEPALRERVALLAGLPVRVIDDLLATRIHATPGAGVLVATMRAAGAYTALVSGGFTAFTGPIAERLGFHEHRANVLHVIEEPGHVHLAGTVREPILGQEAKRAALADLTARFGLPPEATLAIGDGANDLAMIRAAGLGVAFHAKPKVAAAAAARIDHGDLTAILYVQGYRRETFVVP